MFDLDDIPFPVATNATDLMRNIIEYDAEKAEMTTNEFKERMGIIETSEASINVANLLKRLADEHH